VGPHGDLMSEKDPDGSGVVEFQGDSESITFPKEPATSSQTDNATVTKQITESAEPDGPKPTMYHGVEFPAYFQGPHFVEVKGSLVMAIDPKCVTIGMKANWERYRHELSELGKKVIEKNLSIKIETV